MLQLVFGFSLEVEGDHGAIKMSRYNRLTIWRCTDRYHKRFRAKDRLTFVVSKNTNLNLTFSKTEEKLIMSLIWPDHAGDGTVLQEFVANRFLLTPVKTNLVDEDD